MATATNTQQYPTTPATNQAVLSVANPNRDGTGTLVTLFTALSTNARVDWVRFVAMGAVTDGMIRVFRHNSLGTFLLVEIPVAATTPSGTSQAWCKDWFPSVPTFQAPSPLVLMTGESLFVSTQNAENFIVSALGWNY